MWRLGASGKFDDYEAMLCAELTSSGTDLNNEPFEFVSDTGDLIVFDGHDGNFHPSISATIHFKDGTSETFSENGLETFVGDEYNARLSADKELLRMAKEARSKGVPVISNTTGRDKKRKQQDSVYQRIPFDFPSFEPSDHNVRMDILVFALVFLFACGGISLILYHLSSNPLSY